MEKDKFVFLTGFKQVTVVSGEKSQHKSGSKDPCCRRYRKGKPKCKDCPEDNGVSSGLKIMK